MQRGVCHRKGAERGVRAWCRERCVTGRAQREVCHGRAQREVCHKKGAERGVLQKGCRERCVTGSVQREVCHRQGAETARVLSRAGLRSQEP